MALKKSELYSSLWSSCDELRGGMDASQYKDYVLVLLFIKYVSDKYVGVPFAPITIPDGASFMDMVALKGKPDIGDQINKKIIAPLANANKLSDLPDFNDATKLGTGKELLTHLNLLDDGRPTHAAVLLFGREPQRFLPTSEIKCAHFHGTEVAKPIPSYQVYKGTVFTLVDQAVDFVMSKLALSVGTRAQSTQAPVSYEIPREVVVEGIVNAIAHRDYTSNSSVQVMLFADRLEVWNPGRLPSSLTLERLRESHGSVPHNPLLAESLYLTKYIERMGTGTGDMIRRCREAGLPEPEFAVKDGVVLDLVYEARDIDQRLGSEDRIDAWFEAKTRGLNDWQKDELKKQWGTMQKVLSSRSRMDRVVSDIIFDFSVKPRLSSERGNAILVASSIFDACKYFSLFQKTQFKGRCAVVTSYNPQAQDVTKEDTGANTETDKEFIYNIYTKLLKYSEAGPSKTKTETYEERAKVLFTKEPAGMKLLVVVDKLLTGFDAPPCTYLYIDKSMQDHGLFQAICRVNRLARR